MTLRLILQRLLSAIPVLFGTTLVTFFILDILPGNAARQLLGVEATAEEVALLEAKLGLNRPASERYLTWLGGVIRGDLGKSLASGQPVTALIGERLGVTAEVVFLALLLTLATSLPIALLAAHHPQGMADRLIALVSVGGLSMPPYILALALSFIFSVKLSVFSAIGFTPLDEGLFDNLKSVTLPAVALALPLCCLYVRFLRGDLIEQMTREDYIVTAVAKGLGPWRVLLNHALRNSIFGLLTLMGMELGSLLGGAVVVEQVFALPGIGQLLRQAINVRDAPLAMGLVLFAAAATVIANLCVDVVYVMLDPRVRYGRS